MNATPLVPTDVERVLLVFAVVAWLTVIGWWIDIRWPRRRYA